MNVNDMGYLADTGHWVLGEMKAYPRVETIPRTGWRKWIPWLKDETVIVWEVCAHYEWKPNVYQPPLYEQWELN